MRLKLCVLFVCVVAMVSCGLFTQTPVCPKDKPKCWMNDPAMPDPRGPDFGATRSDAGPDGG
jgi:hypothetical protein